MATLSTVATSFLIAVTIFPLCYPLAQSDGNGAALIQQITSKQTTDECAGVSPPASCPITCFRADPVCGVDGVTYWCGCHDAICSGARVATLGPCELGNGGAVSVPGQALLLVHIVWLVLLGFSLILGLL